MNLLDEATVETIFFQIRHPNALGSFQVVKTRPEVEQVKTIFEATQILPILSKQGWCAAWNQFELVRYLKNQFHWGRPWLVSRIPGSDQQSPGKRRAPQ